MGGGVRQDARRRKAKITQFDIIEGALKMNREDALKLVKQHVKTRNLIKHMLATEAVMASLAKRLGEDEEKWALAGLLHDIDYYKNSEDPDRHHLSLFKN